MVINMFSKHSDYTQKSCDMSIEIGCLEIAYGCVNKVTVAKRRYL